ncbi:MAG: XdhC/CoxI family protein [Opitutales bacterium]|jgi:xanthine/CO dehydrogenase XdhC/CoxF family maturation factor
MKELPAIIRELEQNAEMPHALATLVSVEGSSYRRVGARLLVNGSGVSIGSISGGCLEEDVRERAGAVLASGEPDTVVYDTTEENDLVWGVGLGCKGVVRVFIEQLAARPEWARTLQRNFGLRKETRLSVVWEGAERALLGTHETERLAGRVPTEAKVLEECVAPPVRLLIFGAGDDAQPLAKMAKEMGWRVEVFDARAAFVTAERFPAADEVKVARPEEAANVVVDAWTVAVVMTHRYRDDVALLRALLPRALPYLGLLGPKTRTERILGELAEAGFEVTQEMRGRLHAPVGLDLGGDTPEAVALSALAEMQSVLAGRDARPLRERSRPIHA